MVDGEVVAAPAGVDEEGECAGAGADPAPVPQPQARSVMRHPLGLGEFLALAKLGDSAALIEQQDTVMMGSPDALALVSADDDDEWRIGVIEGLDLRGRPPRLAIGRGDDGSSRYAPVLHYWRVERGNACSPVGSADGEALSAEDVAVVSEEATDAPT